jgi:hypothetical protein
MQSIIKEVIVLGLNGFEPNLLLNQTFIVLLLSKIDIRYPTKNG